MFQLLRRRLIFAWRVLSSTRTFDEEVKRAVEQEFAQRDARRAVDVREQLRATDDARTELLRLVMATRRETAVQQWQRMPARQTPGPLVSVQPFDALLERLRQEHPALYPLWSRLNLEVGPAVYASKPETSCSTGERAADQPFSGFVAPHLHGDVLDIGCGPYAIPDYLRGYPVDRIAAIDPLEPFEPHPFVFARSLAEFLPFPDRSFDTVIAATSLDHVLSLDRTMSEIVRVIKPGGSLVVWDGFVRGAPRYDPATTSTPIDDYHIFHFDEDWFEELMAERGFTIREKLACDPSPHVPQYSVSYFYCFKARD